VVEQKWIVSGSNRHGLPTEFAERILVALITVTAESDFIDRKVPISIYRMLKMQGLSPGKIAYDKVRTALKQLASVLIYSESAFYDKETDTRITTEKGFHIIDDFQLQRRSKNGQSTREGNSYIVWSETIWRSFKSGYIKRLDTDFYYSLDGTLARRLYRFLDKRMAYQDRYEIDIFDLAARLGMTIYKYPSQIARKLQPAFDELSDRGYLVSAERVKVGKYHRVRFVRKSDLYELPCEPKLSSEIDDDDEPEIILDETLSQTWIEILAELQQHLPNNTHYMIVGSTLVEIDGDEAVIACDARYADFLKMRLADKILSRLQSYLGLEVKTIRIVEPA
jgi:hypothetical protein